MRSKDMSMHVEAFLSEANRLQWKKNADYHPDGVAMLEILQTACDTGVTVEQDLWGRIRKQISALRRFVIEGHVESEPPRQRMMDVAVYMAMMAFWTEHKDRCIVDAYEFVSEHQHCERGRGLMCVGATPPIDICDRCRFQKWLIQHADPRR
jgi:hypothetical protein